MKKIIAIIMAVVMTTLMCTSIGVQAAVLRQGSRGEQVKLLQRNLNGLGYSAGTVDGIYGTKTTNAVKSFQRNYALEVDGIAGNITQSKIDEIVKQLQRDLNYLGYNAGAVDGSYGPATTNAVIALQRANGLYVDGIAGVNTLNKIQALKVSRVQGVQATSDVKLVDNINQVNILKQGWKSCKATAVAQSLNILIGKNAYTTYGMGGSNCVSINGNCYTASNGNVYKAIYKRDTYIGSFSEQKAKIDAAVANGLPIIVAVHSSTGTKHHWITIIGRNNNTYDIIDPANGKITTMAERNYSFGLADYNDGYHYGYVCFEKQ